LGLQARGTHHRLPFLSRTRSQHASMISVICFFTPLKINTLLAVR